MTLRVLDLFSGIGGFSLGLERTGGFETVAFCEIDPFCRRVLAKHWPNVPCFEDVTTLRGESVGPVDVICGGFPCQRFSTAARGRNNAADLWPDMLRLIEEVRPGYAIAENVPGLGLEGVERVCRDLEAADYAVWPYDLDTAPPGRQRARRRFIFVAHANGESKPRRSLHEQVARLLALSVGGPEDAAAPVGVDDGLPQRMDRLRSLGNAVVPQIPEMIGRAILEARAA